MSRPITFLSDYGYSDEFAGVCRAVIARIAPGSSVTDISHGVPRHDVAAGAAMLANALPFCAPGVHLAVVDPGVGSPRRAVGVLAAEEDRVLVGPDNGLLSAALERLGGAEAAVDISESAFCLRPVSATFHGRDVFAPVAARLAAGAALTDAGEAIDPATLVVLEVPAPLFEGERAMLTVLAVDGFGNLALNLAGAEAPEYLRAAARIRVEWSSGETTLPLVRTFADVAPGEGLLHTDSAGALALAFNRGSAAERLGLRVGDEVILCPAR